MAKTKQQILETLRDNRSKLKQLGISQIGLFGSFVREDQNDNSDIDLLMEFDRNQKTYKNFISAINFVENILGKNVDVITQQSLSPYIKPHIEKEIEYVQIT